MSIDFKNRISAFLHLTTHGQHWQNPAQQNSSSPFQKDDYAKSSSHAHSSMPRNSFFTGISIFASTSGCLPGGGPVYGDKLVAEGEGEGESEVGPHPKPDAGHDADVAKPQPDVFEEPDVQPDVREPEVGMDAGPDAQPDAQPDVEPDAEPDAQPDVPPPDFDGDGVPDALDNCPQLANPEQTQSDNDSRGDACDNCPNIDNENQADRHIPTNNLGDLCDDPDQDQVVDAFDNCRDVSNDQSDLDGDRLGDACDNDIDGDGILNVVEDANGNGVVDEGETDPRNRNTDGDLQDDGVDFAPLDPNEWEDLDTDGFGDNLADNCPGLTNPALPGENTQPDLDLDGEGDACDDDIDGDGLTNDAETILGTSPRNRNTDGDEADDGDDDFPLDPTEILDTDDDEVGDNADNCPLVPNRRPGPGLPQADLDADGIGDICDNDVDGDRVNNDIDNCEFVSNADQTNTDELHPDGDADGDACDDDDDADDVLDVADNCPATFNPLQEDQNGDRVGDACADDIDGDRVNNDIDNCPTISNADQIDSDGDNVGDLCDPFCQFISATYLFQANQVEGVAPANRPTIDVTVRGAQLFNYENENGQTQTRNIAQLQSHIERFQAPAHNQDISASAGFGVGGENFECLLPNGTPGATHVEINHNPEIAAVNPLVDALATPQGRDICFVAFNDGQGENQVSVEWSASDSDADALTQTFQLFLDAAGQPPIALGNTPIESLGENRYKITFGAPLLNSASHYLYTISADDNRGGSLNFNGSFRTALDPQCVDGDGDTLINVRDNCPNAANLNQADRHIPTNNVGDVCDDPEGDGVVDSIDNCPDTINADQANLDQDSFGDVCDIDRDGDGVLNGADNCPDLANADQRDVVHPGNLGDACEDFDNDTVVDATDNCPSTANAGQQDADIYGGADSVGDACDNCEEVSNAGQQDSDANGIGDACTTTCEAVDDEVSFRTGDADATIQWRINKGLSLVCAGQLIENLDPTGEQIVSVQVPAAENVFDDCAVDGTAMTDLLCTPPINVVERNAPEFVRFTEPVSNIQHNLLDAINLPLSNSYGVKWTVENQGPAFEYACDVAVRNLLTGAVVNSGTSVMGPGVDHPDGKELSITFNVDPEKEKPLNCYTAEILSCENNSGASENVNETRTFCFGDDNIALAWTFLDGAGDVVTDISGHGLHGTLVGNLDPNSWLAAGGIDCGGSRTIEIQNDTDFGVGAVSTIVATLRVQQIRQQTLMTWGNVGQLGVDNNYRSFVEPLFLPNGKFKSLHRGQDMLEAQFTTNDSIQVEDIYMDLAYVNDGGTQQSSIKIYKNAVLAPITYEGDGGVVTAQANSLRKLMVCAQRGGGGPQNYADISLHSFKIYTVAKSPADLLTLCRNNNLAVNEKPCQ